MANAILLNFFQNVG